MDLRRVERTLLHKKIGLFGYSGELERHGVIAPYKQIASIGRIIEQQISRAERLPSLSDDAEVENWLRDAVRREVQRAQDELPQPEPLDHIALRTARFVAWNPYSDFAELLNISCGAKAYQIAANKLHRRGYNVNVDDLSALTEQFLLLRLGRAVRSFDPRLGQGREAEWLATVFYRFALKNLISDRQNTIDLEQLRSVAASSPPLTQEQEAALDALPEALERLPEQERLALKLYFGFHGWERTLSEIADALGTSQYLARTAIVRGMNALTSQLGIRGELDEREYSLVRLLFSEGMDLKVAAKRLGLDERKARGLLGQINEKFHEKLRTRTKRAWKYDVSSRPEKEIIMHDKAILSDEQIVTELKELRRTPELRPSETGLQARFDDYWVAVDRVREIVLRTEVGEQLIPLLEERGVSGWLITPDPSIERADLPSDYYEWAEELQRVAQRPWVIAEMLYVRSLDEAAPHLILLDEKKQETVERIYRTLGGVAQAIEAELPRSLRRRGYTYFRIERQGDSEARGGWQDDPEERTFDMRSEIQHRAKLLGELWDEFAEVLAKVTIKELFEGEITLPGFQRSNESTPERVWLKLLPRTTWSSLRAIESSNTNEENSQSSASSGE